MALEAVYIDINCDVGEGLDNEAAIFPHISSCSIACGGHAGDADTIRRILRLASQHGVKTGAHPSYPDRESFGRVSMDIPAAELIKSIRKQLALYERISLEELVPIHHIKAHGALYNDLVKDPRLVQTYLKAIAGIQPEIRIYAPYGSSLAFEVTKRRLRCRYEAFGDRAYADDLQLAPRTEAGAVLTDPEQVLAQILSIVQKGQVTTLSGQLLPMKASTYCIHSDTPSALEILMYLSVELPKHGIYLKNNE